MAQRATGGKLPLRLLSVKQACQQLSISHYQKLGEGSRGEIVHFPLSLRLLCSLALLLYNEGHRW